MTAITDIVLTRESSGEADRTVIFRAVSNFQNKKSQPAISIPIINTAPSGNVLFRFFGQEEEVSFNFALFYDGVDVSNGTAGSVKTSINDQITWIRDSIYTHEVLTKWSMRVDSLDGRFYAGGIFGIITDLTFNNESGGTEIVSGTLTFKRGSIVTFD